MPRLWHTNPIYAHFPLGSRRPMPAGRTPHSPAFIFHFSHWVSPSLCGRLSPHLRFWRTQPSRCSHGHPATPPACVGSVVLPQAWLLSKDGLLPWPSLQVHAPLHESLPRPSSSELLTSHFLPCVIQGVSTSRFTPLFNIVIGKLFLFLQEYLGYSWVYFFSFHIRLRITLSSFSQSTLGFWLVASNRSIFEELKSLAL